jgi:hypothetical protein
MRLISIETRHAPFIEAYRTSAQDQGFDLVLTKPGAVPSSAFERFKTAYRHYSDNPIDFELNCFRRYFDALEHIQGQEAVIIADTDQLILSSPQTLPEIYFDGGAVVGSRGTSKQVAEFDISPHFSKWPVNVLRRFTEFLIYVYTEIPEQLAREYEDRRKLGGRVAVSDMTLFNMFVMTEKIVFHDSNSLRFKTYVDHNLSMSDTGDGFFRMEFGFKAFRRDQLGKIYLVNSTGEMVRPLSLHLQGRAKLAAVAIHRRAMTEARYRLATITTARNIRSVLK